MIDQKLISAAYYSSMPSIIIIKTPVKYFTQVRQMKGNRKHIWCLIDLQVNTLELKSIKEKASAGACDGHGRGEGKHSGF